MELPTPGLGTMGIDDPSVIEAALDLGYRHLDTAQIYDNEGVVGDGLAASDVSRDDVVVATKVWADSLARDDVPSSTAESLDRLGLDAVDLLYVHRPIEDYDPADTLPAFDELVADGRVRGVGVSNFSPAQVDTATEHLDAPVVANQVEYHPLFQPTDALAHAQRHGYALVAYSPLAGGRARDIDAVVDVAERRDVTPEAVCLAWLLAKENVVPIPKASSEAHLRANLAARDLSLTADDVAAIDGIEREVELFPE